MSALPLLSCLLVGVFYHKLKRSGKLVHEAQVHLQSPAVPASITCPEGVGVRACVCDVIKMAVWPCACWSRQRFGRLQRNWRISADQWSSYRTEHIWSERGSSPLAEEPSCRHEFDPETITAQHIFRCMALNTVVPPHPPGVLCAQTGRPLRRGAPKRPFLHPERPAALAPGFSSRGAGYYTPFLTSLSSSETAPQASACILPYALQLGKENSGRGGGMYVCVCMCVCVCVCVRTCVRACVYVR